MRGLDLTVHACGPGHASHSMTVFVPAHYPLFWAMRETGNAALMSGTVEIDETYVGGRLRSGSQSVEPGKRPHDILRPIANKAPVVSLVERSGKVRSFHVANVTAANLKQVIRENVEPTAHLMTDGSGVYAAKEYSRREADGTHVTTNTVEGFFSLLKRGVYGSFHHVSKRHLHRYLSEFDFRYNARDVDDGERRQLAIKGVIGKRLTYYPVKGDETASVLN